MILLLITGIVAFSTTLVLTILVRKFAFKYGVCAQANQRTVHQYAVPLLGGVALFVAFLVSFAIIFSFSDEFMTPLVEELFVFLVGGAIILLLGAFDDIKGADWYEKLSAQFLAAIIVISFGYKITAVHIPFSGQLSLGWLGVPITLLWIVGITNALNLIDGLDGLAAGISFGAACMILFVSLWFDNILSAFPAAILAGSLAAFLIFNFNPAKIFLGDSGSLFLGFMLACFSINGTFRDSSAVALFIPVIVMGIPILDTFLAILRRLRKHVHPFTADKEHIHHRLLSIGFSHRQVVLIMIGISYLWGIAAVMIFVTKNELSLILLLTVFLITCWGVKRIGLGQYFVFEKNKELRKFR